MEGKKHMYVNKTGKEKRTWWEKKKRKQPKGEPGVKQQ